MINWVADSPLFYDEDWLVPHFEKMLYDNAQLVSLYSHAYQSTKIRYIKQLCMKPLILLKRVNSSWRRLYSSLDADIEGEEGKYYVWTAEELTAILGQEAPIF
jgi:uncharacterized protein YyaL (SSP411 family)